MAQGERAGRPAARRQTERAEGPWTSRPEASPHQIVASMFGLEHLGHLAEVVSEVLLVSCAGERDGDDPLRDIYQVQLTAVLHGPAHTHVSGETGREGGLDQNAAPTRRGPDICTPCTLYVALISNPGARLLPDPEPRPESPRGKACAAIKASLKRAGQGLAGTLGRVRTKE